MQPVMPLACLFSIIRPPSIQFESAVQQFPPIDKDKCPYVINDIGFQLYTRHNPTAYNTLRIDDDESLFASNFDFHAPTVIIFHAYMETPDDGSALWLREAYMVRGDSNIITVDAQRLEAGPWYVKAAHNTWYIGHYAAMFIDYLVSRGLQLSNTHFVGHSLGAHSAGVAGGNLKSGLVSRITGMDPALPLFHNVPLEQRLDPSDAQFVDVIHTDAGIFGFAIPLGHVDFYPNGGISPQPGCDLETVLPTMTVFTPIFCSHWRSYMFYAESVVRPQGFLSTSCASQHDYDAGLCAHNQKTHLGYGVNRTTKVEGYYVFYLREKEPIETFQSKPRTTKIVKKTVNNMAKKFYDIETKNNPLENEENNFSKKFNPINILMKKKPKTNQISKSYNKKSIYIKTDKKSRQRRFASFFKREDNNNNLFKLLDFFVRNGKNIVPVISVIREIDTLVKTSTGELNHKIKEHNNFIGSTATLAPVTYNIQYNGDSKIMAFLKKIFGFGKGNVSLVT